MTQAIGNFEPTFAGEVEFSFWLDRGLVAPRWQSRESIGLAYGHKIGQPAGRGGHIVSRRGQDPLLRGLIRRRTGGQVCAWGSFEDRSDRKQPHLLFGFWTQTEFR
jgi:hypothetical protein